MPSEKTFSTNTSGVESGNTTQLSMQMPSRGKLKGFFPDKGLTLRRVIAGKERIQEEDGFFTFGQTVERGVWVIAIVENTSQAPIIGSAKWLIEGENLPDEKKVAQPSAGIIPMKVVKPPIKAGVKKPVPDGAVLPGKNELAICFTYGEAKRLLDAVAGGMPIQNFEQPAILRRFNQAFAIFGGDSPEESEPEPPEKDAVISELEATISSLRTALEDLAAVDPPDRESIDFEAGYREALTDLKLHAHQVLIGRALSNRKNKAVEDEKIRKELLEFRDAHSSEDLKRLEDRLKMLEKEKSDAPLP